MKSNIPLLWSVIVLGAVGAVCTVAIIPRKSDPTPQNPVSVISTKAVVGLPVRLIIPKIDVNAAITPVGLTSDGAMGVPIGPTGTTWFNLGPRPGEEGSAVIAGHEGWKDGIAAVFDDLHTLRPGDKIYIEDDRGATTTFTVRALRLYDQNADATTIFDSNDGTAHLNLITCEGTWNAAQKSYSDRLVVFADEETE